MLLLDKEYIPSKEMANVKIFIGYLLTIRLIQKELLYGLRGMTTTAITGRLFIPMDIMQQIIWH